MYELQPKKFLVLNMLMILHQHTDESHRLSQKDIVGILKNEYVFGRESKSHVQNSESNDK